MRARALQVYQKFPGGAPLRRLSGEMFGASHRFVRFRHGKNRAVHCGARSITVRMRDGLG
jgi:hypothetical protein